MITGSGFSWPSTVPCCRAVNTSGKAMGVVMMPKPLYAAMCTGFSMVRIFRRVHRALAVRHVAKAVLGPGQGLEALAIELGQHLLADGAIQHRTRMGLVAEQEGHVKDARFGHKVGHGAGGAEGQLLRAQLHGFNRFALATQGAVVERLYLVAAGRALFDFL